MRPSRSDLAIALLGALALSAGSAQAAPHDVDRTFGANGATFVPFDGTTSAEYRLAAPRTTSSGALRFELYTDRVRESSVSAMIIDGDGRARATAHMFRSVEYSAQPDGDTGNAHDVIVTDDGGIAGWRQWDPRPPVLIGPGPHHLLVARSGQALVDSALDWAPELPLGLRGRVRLVAADPMRRLVATVGGRLVRLTEAGQRDTTLGGDTGRALPEAVASPADHNLSGGVLRLVGRDRGGVTLWRADESGAGAVRAVRAPLGAALRSAPGAQLAVAPSGRAVVITPTRPRGGGPDDRDAHAIVAFQADGTLERRFGALGVVRRSGDGPDAVAIQSDGRVLTATITGPRRAATVVVRRQLITGRPDPAFRPTVVGRARPGASAVALYVDRRGRITVIARVDRPRVGQDPPLRGILVARLRGDGCEVAVPLGCAPRPSGTAHDGVVPRGSLPTFQNSPGPLSVEGRRHSVGP